MRTFALVAILLAPVVTFAADAPPLGAPDFQPTPERPIGWRGDGSGRFPGATPPVTWSRRVAGLGSQIVVQAAKPKGAPGAESHNLAYFTIKDWLVVGPFPADPAADIDKDFIGGEATVEPDVGLKAGSAVWKAHRACEATQPYHEYNAGTCSDMYVDLVDALGTRVEPDKPYAKGYGSAVYASLDRQAAYAHTYLYSPQAADMDLDILHDLPAVKLWVNGVPQAVGIYKVFEHKPLKIHLNQGWNHLLIKTICDKATANVNGRTSKWRFAAHLMPTGSNLNSPGGHGSIGPMSYETKNIAWMTKLTGRSASQPIVVGDKIFVGSGTSDLVCLDKNTGKILWLHTVSYWDAMPPEQRAAVKDRAEPALAAVEKANADLVAALNAGVTSQGLDSIGQKSLDAKLDPRNKLVRALHDAVAEGKKGRLYENEVSAGNAAPASDGKRVYWLVQGNGGFLSCAFDLSGKLAWANIVAKSGAGEHGSHRSPALCAGKLIVPTNDELIAYDAPTGKELWRTPGASHQHGIDGWPMIVTLGGGGRPAGDPDQQEHGWPGWPGARRWRLSGLGLLPARGRGRRALQLLPPGGLGRLALRGLSVADRLQAQAALVAGCQDLTRTRRRGAVPCRLAALCRRLALSGRWPRSSRDHRYHAEEGGRVPLDGRLQLEQPLSLRLLRQPDPRRKERLPG